MRVWLMRRYCCSAINAERRLSARCWRALIRSEFSRVTVRHTELTPTSFKDFLAGLTKRHHFLCQLSCRRTAPVVVIRDHSMFLGRKMVDLPRIAAGHYPPCSEHRRQRIELAITSPNCPCHRLNSVKTLAFNAKIRLV